jgi:hypothetical protein
MTDQPQLRPEQVERLAQYIANPRFLDLSDPGTGKTPPVCVYLRFQWSEHGHKSLWAMPKSLLQKNRDELLRFTDFRPEDVVILEDDKLDPTQAQRNQLRKHVELGHKRFSKELLPYRKFWPRLLEGEVIDLIAECEAKVILVGFRFMARFWQRLVQSQPAIGCLAVDELHMAFGSVDSQNTKSLFGIMRHAKSFIGMTGTLLNGRLDSVYPAIHVIEPRYYISYAGFRQQHVAFEDSYGNVLSWKNLEKVGQILLNHGIRRTFEEVYGKEDVVFLPDQVTMGPEMREQYDLFHEQAMLELETGEFLDGSLPGVATIRARQIMAHPETMLLCKGEVTGKDERLMLHVEDAKARGESLLIFSVHTAEQERIKRLLESMGRRVGLMNGNTTTAQRAEIDRAFKARELDDVVGSPKTMAVGWNWEHVDHVVAVSYEYQDVDWLQAYRRASRGTRTKTLRVSIMQYKDSIDKRVLQIVREKSILANKVDPTRPVLQLAA